MQHPDLHVYHFGAYEETAIKQLMGTYATREAEVDDLLIRKIFVNLHSIFHQAVRAGVASYSLKKLEPLFGFARVGAVRSGIDAIVEYERWREGQDQKFLEQIAAYNEEDCRATLGLFDGCISYDRQTSPGSNCQSHAPSRRKEQKRSMRVSACAKSL